MRLAEALAHLTSELGRRAINFCVDQRHGFRQRVKAALQMFSRHVEMTAQIRGGFIEPFFQTLRDSVSVAAGLRVAGLHEVEPLIDSFEPPIHLFEPLIDLIEPLIHLFEPPIHLFEPLIHLFEPLIHLFEPLIHLIEPLIHLVEPLIHLLDRRIQARFHPSDGCVEVLLDFRGGGFQQPLQFVVVHR